MNRKTLKVQLMLLDNPCEWMDTQEIGYETNLTSRQVCSIVSQLPSPPLEKKRGSGGISGNEHVLMVRWNESDEDIRKRRRDTVSEYYNLTPDMYRDVMDTLSSVGWMTVYDICSETGMPKDAVARIVRMADGVEVETSGRVCLYRKAFEASD